jgi:hypothetical protein
MVTNAKHLFDGSRGCGPSNIGNCFKFDDWKLWRKTFKQQLYLSQVAKFCHKKTLNITCIWTIFFILYYNRIGILNHLKSWIFFFHFIYFDQMGSIFNKSSNYFNN